MGKKKKGEQQESSKVRIPQEGEILGIVEMFVGGDKMRVICDDGEERLCRIPGRLRKRVWIRVGDLILVRPWKYQKGRGDVIHVYTRTQANWLKKNGHIKNLEI